MNCKELFMIDSPVRNQFPGVKVGLALIRGLNVVTQRSDLDALKTELTAQIENDLRGVNLASLPKIQCFRKIYRGFGADPGSHRPSAEALMRRIARSGELYAVNSVVDTYNLLSALYQLPMAAYDLDHLVTPVELRFSREGDLHIPIGQTEPDSVPLGELVYADQQKVICREFNYRDSEATKVTLTTKNLLLFVDGCEVVELSELEAIVGKVAEKIREFCGGEVEMCCKVNK